MRCSICNRPLIDAQVYDPEGVMPLYGGYKEYNNEGLVKWFICINPICQQEEKINNNKI